jgi:hypothetical protein
VNPGLDAELRRNFERRAREMLDAETERVRAAGVTVARAHLRMGKADREVVALAEEVGVGFIVVGSRGRGWGKARSDGQRIGFRGAACSLPRPRGTPLRMCVTVDTSGQAGCRAHLNVTKAGR